MQTVCSFLTKFASLILWVLHCFDRVIYKGYLPISRLAEFEKFVDCILKQRRADFAKKTARQWSQRLVEHAQSYARQHRRPFEYRQGKVDKDHWAQEPLASTRRDPGTHWHPVRPGNVSHVPAGRGSGPAVLPTHPDPTTGPVLLLSGSRPGVAPCAATNLGAVHLSGLRQWA